MPADIELAFECLKHGDEDLYKVYKGFRHAGIAIDELDRGVELAKTLLLYREFVGTMDQLEDEGYFEIINDYEKGEVVVNENYRGGLDGISI